MGHARDGGHPEVRSLPGMGLSLGCAFRVNEGLRVMPEVALLMAVAERVLGQWVRMDGQPNLQAGLFFMMGPVR